MYCGYNYEYSKGSVPRRLEEGTANVGTNDNQVPLQENQVPQLEEVAMVDHVQVIPPPMTDGDIKGRLFSIFPNP